MGLSRLYLVSPKQFPHADAQALATGATDLLDNAILCESLDEALAGTVLAVAATARHRDLAHEVLDCRETCRRLVAEGGGGADVAVVFGTERSGLTTEEVSRCHLISMIATNWEYSSLNLAQAVQVFAYELRMNAMHAQTYAQHVDELATHEEVEGFFGQLEDAFYATGFLDPKEPKRLMQRMRRLFARARLEKKEVNVLRGFLSAIKSSGDRGTDKS
ncbi:MAG TPA: RNA methyltransferase, partial [Burkholderiales bacterium]|nr:RNA methyltransferase [Burkholderiales bacterium]